MLQTLQYHDQQHVRLMIKLNKRNRVIQRLVKRRFTPMVAQAVNRYFPIV